MANSKFTARLRAAVDQIADDASLGLIACPSGSLYSPVYRRKYSWAKLMDSDGLLVTERNVHSGEGGSCDDVAIRLGVIIQSEDATAQTKPNPLGKASLAHIPNGVWINDTVSGRRRLDRFLVLFVLPKGAAPKRAAAFSVAKRNVENAALLMPEDSIILELSRGTSQTAMVKELTSVIRPFLRGAGRPRKS